MTAIRDTVQRGSGETGVVQMNILATRLLLLYVYRLWRMALCRNGKRDMARQSNQETVMLA
jgi:hypothetical protein